MESIELATFKIDLSSLNETLDKVKKEISKQKCKNCKHWDVEFEKKLKETNLEFAKSGLSINEFFLETFKNLEKQGYEVEDWNISFCLKVIDKKC